MPLTRDFKETVQARVERDPALLPSQPHESKPNAASHLTAHAVSTDDPFSADHFLLSVRTNNSDVDGCLGWLDGGHCEAALDLSVRVTSKVLLDNRAERAGLDVHVVGVVGVLSKVLEVEGDLFASAVDPE